MRATGRSRSGNRRATHQMGQSDLLSLCERALAEPLRTAVGHTAFRDNWPLHLKRPEDNLVQGVRLGDVAADFGGGAGSELAARGDEPPKFCAVHSSAALVANAFGPFRTRPGDLRLGGHSGATRLRFEATCPTGLGGTPPHLVVSA